VNLHDSPPFARAERGTLGRAKEKLRGAFSKGVKAQQARDGWARRVVRSGTQTGRQIAEAHYRRAMCLEQVAQLEERAQALPVWPATTECAAISELIRAETI